MTNGPPQANAGITDPATISGRAPANPDTIVFRRVRLVSIFPSLRKLAQSQHESRS
jgi:hypothetical protein